MITEGNLIAFLFWEWRLLVICAIANLCAQFRITTCTFLLKFSDLFCSGLCGMVHGYGNQCRAPSTETYYGLSSSQHRQQPYVPGFLVCRQFSCEFHRIVIMEAKKCFGAHGQHGMSQGHFELFPKLMAGY